MLLPASQRSSVILSDVLGYSLQEICEFAGGSVPAVKAALQRGRARLRALAAEADDARVPTLAEPERTRLKTYVERFNAHDFDAVRAMLAEDVRLEIVNRVRLDGKTSVAPYFGNYAARPHWRFLPGFVDRRPAMLVYDADDPDQRLKYFVLLAWAGERVVGIRDFVFARYAMDGAELAVMDSTRRRSLPTSRYRPCPSAMKGSISLTPSPWKSATLRVAKREVVDERDRGDLLVERVIGIGDPETAPDLRGVRVERQDAFAELIDHIPSHASRRSA